MLNFALCCQQLTINFKILWGIMRVIFVGLHNKPGKMPLCHSTKSGKLITRIINRLPKGIEKLRTNLFEVDYLPIDDELYSLQDKWYWTYLPVDDDIIVLLGAMNHKLFAFKELNIIKIAHPASKRSHEAMSDYVDSAVAKILELISKGVAMDSADG